MAPKKARTLPIIFKSVNLKYVSTKETEWGKYNWFEVVNLDSIKEMLDKYNTNKEHNKNAEKNDEIKKDFINFPFFYNEDELVFIKIAQSKVHISDDTMKGSRFNSDLEFSWYDFTKDKKQLKGYSVTVNNFNKI